MDEPDASPPHPFDADSAAGFLVRAFGRGLGRGWRFEHDQAAWTATRNEVPDGDDRNVRVEDGARYGQGPVITAFDGDFQYVFRLPPGVTPYGLHRTVRALVVLGVLPVGRYFA